MGIPAYVQGMLAFGYKSVAFGTIIQQNVPPMPGCRTALLRAKYTAAGTAHTLSILYPATTNGGHAPAAATLAGSKNTASAAAAAAQAIINVTTAPTDPAGNAAASGDIIAYQCTDGTWEFNVVASLAVKAITCVSNLAKPIAIGAKVRIIGILADGYNMQEPCAASVTTTIEGEPALLTPDFDEPCVLQSNNATATGFLLSALFAHINK